MNGVSRKFAVECRIVPKPSELQEIARGGWAVLHNSGMVLASFCCAERSDLDGFVRSWTIVFGFGRRLDDGVRLGGGLDGVDGRGIVAAFGVAVRICSDCTRLRSRTSGRRCCRTDVSECAGCAVGVGDSRNVSVDWARLRTVAACWTRVGRRAGVRLPVRG